MLPCPSDIKLDKNSIKKVIILNLTFAPKSRSEALHLNIAIYHYIYREKTGIQGLKTVMKNLSLFNLGRNPENEKNLKKERIIRIWVPMKSLFQFRISSNKNMKNGLSEQSRNNCEISS